MMKNKKGFARVTALCLVLCIAVSLFACTGEENPVASEEPEKMDYTITVMSQGGQPLVGVGVGVYTDESLNELVWFAKTDDEGKISFSDYASDTNVAVLSNLPSGYQADACYPIREADTVITLSAVLGEVEDLTTVTYGLGDVMNDFTVTDAAGNTYTLSKLLEEKNAVVLNFWYLECDPCKMEFPYLQKAYEAYSDTVEVLSMNPVNTDPDAVAAFRERNGYTFPMMVVDPSWSEAMALTAYPTTVVIDRYGTITMVHTGTLTEDGVWESIFDFFGSEEYQQTIIEDVGELPSVEEEQTGTADNPIEMSAQTSFTLTVPADSEIYLRIYKVTSYYMQVRSPYATITYGGKTYTASNGAVGVNLVADDVMSAVDVVVGNTSNEDQIFSVTMSAPKGSYENPYTLEMGEFSVTVPAGNNQGIYYTYTAAEDGVLTVKCLSVTAGVPYDLVLYNLSTYAYRNLMSNPEKDEDGYYSVSVNVKAGNRVQFIAGTQPDDSGSYPRADFRLLATMGDPVEDEEEEVEKLTYSVTITDENRNPISGVQIYLNNAEGESINISTDTNGVAYTKQPAGTYAATLKVPAGYEARNTAFQLTEAIPSISLKLDTIVVETETYTVTVVDEWGNAISGALVSIGDTFGYTDDTGSASFTLPKDIYTVAVSADGYLDTSASFFGEANTMTVTLEEGEAEVVNGVSYSVTVADYFGNPISGVTVSFLRNGTAVAMKPSDAAGMVTRTLEAGTYTVSLAFSSGSYYYSTVTLTETEPSATITVVEKISGSYVSAYVGELYEVPLGASYAELQSGVVNYFLFTPTQPGYYSFTTADSADEISYWGGNLSYIADVTASVEHEGNTFLLNIKQESVDNGLCYVIGVTGSGGCTLVIRRLGDAQTDIYDMPWSTEWMEGVELPNSQIRVTDSGTLTHVDVSMSCTLVLGSDGYYHVGSANGPVLYLRLDSSAPYISFADLLANSGMKVYFFDEEGNFLKKEEYTDYMNACIACMDAVNGLYPVTETLAYILQTYGEYVGWYDSTNEAYLFGSNTVDPTSAWLFACCYFN